MNNQQQAKYIKQILEQHFSGNIEVIDDSDLHIGHSNHGSGHYTINITDEKFHLLSRLERHRMVYEILQNPQLGLKIHAMALNLSSSNL